MSLRSWFARLRFPERAVLLPLLLIAASCLGFIAIADEVIEGDTRDFDEAVVRALRHPDDPARPAGPDWLGEVGRDVTALGGMTVIGSVTIAVVGFLWLQGKRHAVWLVIAAVVGGGLATELMKELFNRERPSLVPHLTRVTSMSFPSGHSMLSAVTYLTLGALLARTTQDRATKVYFIGLAILLSLLIGVSRVYLGVHYPTDVLAGWCAGIAWALLCASFARWLQQRGKVEPATPSPAAIVNSTPQTSESTLPAP
jgi:undecaprenyl-diphosphatase